MYVWVEFNYVFNFYRLYTTTLPYVNHTLQYYFTFRRLLSLKYKQSVSKRNLYHLYLLRESLTFTLLPLSLLSITAKWLLIWMYIAPINWITSINRQQMKSRLKYMFLHTCRLESSKQVVENFMYGMVFLMVILCPTIQPSAIVVGLELMVVGIVNSCLCKFPWNLSYYSIYFNDLASIDNNTICVENAFNYSSILVLLLNRFQ